MRGILSVGLAGFAALVLLVSCGGGGGGSAPDTTPPTIVSTDPAVRSTSGQTRAVNVTFSESISSATVSAATLTVSRGGAALAGNWSASGSMASFTPKDNLCFFSLHSATVTTGIKDLAGNALASGLTWTFTTGDGTWDSSLVSVDTSTTHFVGSPDIGMDSSGNAVAVWLQENGGIGEVWASKYTLGVGWSTPVQLDSRTNTGALSGMDPPHVAVNGSGNAVVVWNERNDIGGSTSRGNIWGSRYSATTGLWSTASLLETDNTWEAGKPQVGIDDAGNAVAVWIQEATGDTAFRVYTSFSSAGTPTWTAPAGSTLNTNYGADNPALAVNGSGEAVVAWSGLQSTVGYRVMAGLVSGGAWAGEMLIDAVTGTGGNYGPTLKAAVNNAGTAFVVWDQVIDGGNEMDVWVNIYSGGTWTNALMIRDAASGSGQGRHAHVAVDSAGNAIVVWDEANVTNEVLARRYAAGTGWEANPTTLDDTGKGFDMNPQIVMDPGGNAIALWSDQHKVYAKRYRAGTGWGSTIATLETNSNAAYTDVAAMTVHKTCGNAIAIWPGDHNFNYGIQTSRFR